MSVSCALLATSVHQWARRYIRLTQPARCSPEKRARMRAFFANGVDEMHIPWAVEGLPTLLHLSLFLFFGGLVIFLFNIDHAVFSSVTWWIGLFSIMYGLITLLPLIRQDSPYYASLSIPAWFLYAGIPYITFKVLAFVTSGSYGSTQTWERCGDLRDRYRGWMLGGVEKKADETAEEQSSEIDVRIFGWTISALGDDDSLEKFFEAVPGWFNSKLVKYIELDFPETLLKTFWGTLDGFMGRTLSSNSVTEQVKSRRLIICRDIMSTMPYSNIYMHDNLRSHFDQAIVSIEKLQAMARWLTHTSRGISDSARIRIAENLARMQERDDHWIALASRTSGLSESDLRHDITHGGDNVLLATLIDVSRRAVHSHELRPVGALTQFDIRCSLPRLQHDFCTLWNDIVQEAKSQDIISIYILRWIPHLYIALHPGTDLMLDQPLSYPLCDIASHRPDSIADVPVHPLTQPGDSVAVSPDVSTHHPTSGRRTVSRQAEEVNIITGPPPPSDPTTTSAPAVPRASDTSSSRAVTSVLLPAAVLSSEKTTQQDIVPPYAEKFDSENLSTGSMPAPIPTLASVTASTPPVLSLASCDAAAASASSPLHPASSIVGLSTSISSSQSHVSPSPNAEFPALFSSMTHSRPTSDVTLPRLRARGLVNAGNMCFVNVVLQLLAHCPPFWNLFRELGDSKGPRGAGDSETGTGATPLVDATVRFFEELMIKEKEPPPTQQPPQQAARGKSKEDAEERKENKVVDPFEPTYVYDAMKEKRLLNNLLVRFRAMQRPDITDVCLHNVYRMVNSMMQKSFSAITLTRLTRNYSGYSLLLLATSRLLQHPE